jgi:hypothetical protein
MANNDVSAGFISAGAYNSYDNIRQPGEYPQYTSSDVPTHLYQVVSQHCVLDTANPPGYSTTLPDYNAALTLLQNIQYIGGTQSSPSTPLAPYKIITRTPTQRTDLIRQAFSKIMQDGIQVSLIQ